MFPLLVDICEFLKQTLIHNPILPRHGVEIRLILIRNGPAYQGLQHEECVVDYKESHPLAKDLFMREVENICSEHDDTGIYNNPKEADDLKNHEPVPNSLSSSRVRALR
jgi:hypothetical protein